MSDQGMAGWWMGVLAGAKARIEALALDLAQAPQETAQILESTRASLMSGTGVRGFTYLMILLFVGIAVEWLYWTYAYSSLRAVQSALPESPAQALRLGLRRLVLQGSGALLFTAAILGVSAAFAWPEGMHAFVIQLALLVLALRASWIVLWIVLAPGRAQRQLVPADPARTRSLAIVAMAALALLALGHFVPAILQGAAGAKHAGAMLRFAAFSLATLVLFVAAFIYFGRPRAPAGAAAPQGRADVRGPLFPRSFLLAVLVVAVYAVWVMHPAGAALAAVVAVVIALEIGLRDIVYFYWREDDQPEAALGALPAIVLSLARFVVALGGIGAAAVALDTSLEALAEGDPLARAALRLLGVAVLALLAHGVWIAVRSLVDQRLARISPATPQEPPGPKSRLLTLLPLLRVTTGVLLLVLLVLSSLWALGIEITPLLAGAGVVGLAIGFGAQTLVRDIVSGVFYLIDDAFRIGEYIQSGTYKGTVESFSLRSVKLRHHRGPLYTIPYGVLGAVQNLSRDWVIDKLTVGITYNSDIDKARKLVKKVGQALAADPELGRHFLEPLKMQGVEQFGDFAVQIRMKMKTQPGEQFVIRRKALAMIKKAFDENGIKFAFPTVQLAGGAEAEAGAAAAAARQVLAREPAPPG